MDFSKRPKPGKWGEIVDGEVVYDLHDAQAKVLDSKARFVAAIAGTGGGKTSLGPLWVMGEMEDVMAKRDIRVEPIAGLVLSPTYRMMARATADELVKAFARSPYRGRYLESKGYYELPNNMGKLWCVSADNPDKIEGKQFDFAWLDEGGQMKYEAWLNVLNRLGLRQGRALITTTPYFGVKWLKDKFVTLANEGDPNYAYVQWDSITNPAYPAEHFELARRSMSMARFEMRYRGMFTRPAGVVYPVMFGCVREFKSEDIPPGVMVGGIDWGYMPDPFAAIVAVRTGPMHPGHRDHLWFVFEHKQTECTSQENARAIPKNCRYWTDSSGGEELKVFRRAGHRVTKNKVMKIHVGIDAVYKRFATGAASIHPRLIKLLAEAEEYRWPTEEEEVVGGEPLGEHHLLDATRYLVANVERFGNARSEEQERRFQQTVRQMAIRSGKF